jgi:hypothetical protein
MPSITLNPNDAVCPDYSSELHAASRAVLISTGLDNAGAIAFLENTWRIQNDADKQAWQAQLDAEAALIAENERLAREAEDAARLAAEEERIAEQREAEKRNNAKFPPLPGAEVTAPDTPPVIISPAVRRKLGAGDWVALWHFTSNGLQDVTRNIASADGDPLSLVRLDDNSFAWVPSHDVKKSRAVVDDADLSWDDFTQAAPRLVLAMQQARWPADRVNMFATFFANIRDCKG